MVLVDSLPDRLCPDSISLNRPNCPRCARTLPKDWLSRWNNLELGTYAHNSARRICSRLCACFFGPPSPTLRRKRNSAYGIHAAIPWSVDNPGLEEDRTNVRQFGKRYDYYHN